MRIAVFILCLVAALPVSAALPCGDESELEAHRIRALQTQLMVAALSCGKQKEYNAFVRSHKSELQEHGRIFQSYFTRTHGAKGESAMNRYVTQLANQFAKQSAKSGVSAFCKEVSETLASAEDAHALKDVAYRFPGQVKACGGKSVRMATASNASTTPTPQAKPHDAKPWLAKLTSLWPF